MSARKVEFVYVASEAGGPAKIGVAVDPDERAKVVAKACVGALTLVWSHHRPADCCRVETLVRRILAGRLHKGFRVQGNGEWFDVPPRRVIEAAEQAMAMLDCGDAASLRRLKVPKRWLEKKHVY